MFPSILTPLKTLLVSLAAVTVTITPSPFNPSAPNVGVSSGTSRNWSGYSSSSGQFTSVSGTWIVPAASGSGHTSADATWIGIGGVKDSDLIQGGTQNIIGRDGQPETSAFYKLLPNAPQTLPVTVKPGDSVTASITQQSSGQWLFTFNDKTTNQNYQTTLAYNSSLSSAEWIEEAPSDGRNVLPLDNFGSVPFSSGSATQNGTAETLSGAGAQAITMTNRQNQTLATPSAIGSDGASFTVTRTSAMSNAPIPQFDNNPRGFRRHGFGIGGFTPFPRQRRQFERVHATTTEPTPTPTVTQQEPASSPSANLWQRRTRFFRRGF